MHSTYIYRLAVDLHLFIDGHDQSSMEAYTPLADNEVRRDPEPRVWGSHGTTLWDAVHVESEGEERAMRDEARNTVDAIGEALNRLIRPFLAIMFGGAIVYMAILGTVTNGGFLGIAAVVVGFFFQARQAEKAQERVQEQQEQLVELAKAVPPEKFLEQQPKIVNG
jgi:hypothetical protein